MMESNLERLQDVEFEMLLELKRICDKYKIRYFLSGGTLLGAVRHKGFIPWDDDVDIEIPRGDYQKLLRVIAEELPSEMEFKSYETDPEYHHPIARIINNKVQVINHSFREGRIEPAWIDIFALDGMPDNEILKIIHEFRIICRSPLV